VTETRGFDIWQPQWGHLGEHIIRCRQCGFQTGGFYATASATTLVVEEMCQCHGALLGEGKE
jgi:hypothetical protein